MWDYANTLNQQLSSIFFSVSNEGIQWFLDFYQESAAFFVKDLVEELTMSSPEVSLPSWNLLLSQRQGFLNSQWHKSQSLLTSEEHLNWGRRFLLVLEHRIGSSGKNHPLEMDAVFRPGIDTCFSPAAFGTLEKWGSSGKAVLLDGEEHKESSPPRTLVSQRRIRFLWCCDVAHLDQELNIILILFTEICFSKNYCVCIFIKTVMKMFHSIIFLSKNRSDLCETKTILVSLSINSLVAHFSRIYKVHTENKVGHHSGIESQSPCGNEYRNFRLNCECFYLAYEDLVRCKCSWWYLKKCCEKFIRWDCFWNQH